MPELPEVQTTVNGLNKKVIGLKIIDFWTDWRKAVKLLPFDEFKKQIIGKKFIKARRRAKYVILDLSEGKSLLIHQKISGHLLYGVWIRKGTKWIGVSPKNIKEDPQNRFVRHIFSLNNGKMLAFSDLRRFGSISLLETKKLDEWADIKNLGPEPLDKNFALIKFQERVSGKKGKVKTLLMDPTFIAGIGNIYSDEILWYAGIHPLRKISDLNKKETKKLFLSIRTVLKKGLKHRGSSIEDFRDLEGDKGSYQNITKAYQQTGKKCPKKDGGVIKRIKIGGRSAHFCSNHQK